MDMLCFNSLKVVASICLSLGFLAGLHGNWKYELKPIGATHAKDVHVAAATTIVKNYLVTSGQWKIHMGDRSFKMTGHSKTAWDKLTGIKALHGFRS